MNIKNIRRLNEVSALIPGAPKGAYINATASESDDVYLLKGVNMTPEGDINVINAEKVSLVKGKNRDRFILQRGDVVVMARGSAIRAGLISDEIAEKGVIASANYITIRPKPEAVSGSVIAAFLNSEFGINLLKGLSVGATIPHITVASLKNLEVPIPEITEQKKIEELFYATKEAYLSTLKLADQQKRTANALIFDLFMRAQ